MSESVSEARVNEHGPYLNESKSKERVNGSASGVKVSEHDIQESELTESVIYVRVREKVGVTEIQESVTKEKWNSWDNSKIE